MNNEKERTGSKPSRKPVPIIDLHCDLLAYLADAAGADPTRSEDIGCAIPHLKKGCVGLQVLAIYSHGGDAPWEDTERQYRWFSRLVKDYPDTFYALAERGKLREAMGSSGIGIVIAIENASGLCSDRESLEIAFERLEDIIKATGLPLYVSLTHNDENRFGGGNNSSAGLKDDGRVLLDYIDGRRIAIDLSHTSDALAYDIITHIDRNSLDIPMIASHSNFRAICEHKRNLPDELARVVIDRQGLIGMNFLRAVLHPSDPSSLTRHIMHGIELGGQDTLCFGADFFHLASHPDQSRVPFFFKEHEHAGNYQQILQSLDHVLSPSQVKGLACENALNFMERLWSSETG